MDRFETGVVYSGTGTISYKNRKIGTLSEINFTVVGLGFRQKEEGSVYGTLNGKIEKTDLIPELNSPHPTPLDLDITLADGDRLDMKKILVIDAIPKSGILKETEFHGTNPFKVR